MIDWPFYLNLILKVTLCFHPSKYRKLVRFSFFFLGVFHNDICWLSLDSLGKVYMLKISITVRWNTKPLARPINCYRWSVNICMSIRKETDRWLLYCKDYQDVKIFFFLTHNKPANIHPFTKPILSFSKHSLKTFYDPGVVCNLFKAKDYQLTHTEFAINCVF